MTELMQTVSAALERRGFQVIHAKDRAEAARKVLALIPEGASIGVGGSVTVRETGVADVLLQRGHAVHWHWFDVEPKADIFPGAARSDVYLCSANAVTRDGQLVNIDGTGNRVAAMIHGPRAVIAIVGANKLVDGGYPQALARIKRDACPPNARRLNMSTPCALTDKCDAANCEHGFCNVISIQEHPTGKRPYTVVLVEEALGY
ncbi:MAG: lactate utilization protein [Clostridia bacterium]|nr:lactate utilization protein [Clostridia bacterium]